ncbi:MAG TPA: hypothetical protein VIO62_06190 [Candidatus Dormibacteraeota bacterium]
MTAPQGSVPPAFKYARAAVGQAFEFRIWSELIHQSRGHLHVFLPLFDRGIDGVVHRLDDGTYIPVQLKARSNIEEGRLHFVVKAASLVDDEALLIAGLLGETGLGPYLLVVKEGTFKQLADRFDEVGHSGYVLAIPMSLAGHSRWLPHMVATTDLGARLQAYGAVVGTAWPEDWVGAPTPIEPPNEWLGFLGEQCLSSTHSGRVSHAIVETFEGRCRYGLGALSGRCGAVGGPESKPAGQATRDLPKLGL